MSAYTYIFTGAFDDATFNAGPVNDEDLKNLVMTTVNSITHVLTYNEGIPTLSSIINYNGNDYTIQVLRS